MIGAPPLLVTLPPLEADEPVIEVAAVVPASVGMTGVNVVNVISIP